MKSQLKIRIVGAALALLTFMAAGCGDDEEPSPTGPTPECTTDLQCEGGLCRLGRCVECVADSDCGAGESCVQSVCKVPDAPADAGPDADTDLVDDDADAAPDGDVSVDNPDADAEVRDCGQGCRGLQRCDTATNTCREPAICLEDIDCFVNRSCFEGACTSNAMLQALGGCASDEDCSAEGGSRFCNLATRRCASDGPCVADADCPTGLLCDGEGTCRSCVVNDDCEGELICDQLESSPTYGLCLEATGCLSDDWCRGDRSCLGSVCQEPACSEDSLVGNQTCEVAATVMPGTTYALQICGDACDWFQVSVPAGDGLLARVQHPLEGGDLDLTLRRAPCIGGGVVARAATLREAEVVYLPSSPSSELYYLEVCPYISAYDMGTSPYALDVQLVPGGFCQDDALDRSGGGNDTPADATRIPADARPFTWTQSALQVCPDRTDWYRLPLREGDLAVLRLDFEDRVGNLALDVYDTLPSGPDEMPRWRSNGRSNSEQLVFTAEATGEVWVHVYASSAAGQVPYQLSASLYGAEGCGDALEPAGAGNNSRGQATRLEGAVSRDGLRVCPGDIDWFEAPLSSGQAATFQLRYDPELAGELRATVFRRSGDPQPLVLTGRDGVLNISATAAAADPVAVRLEGSTASATIPYSLLYRAVPEGESCLDDARANNSFATAWLSGFGVQEFGGELCPGTGDYFLFDVPPQTRVMADLLADGDAGAMTLELFDSNQLLIGSGTESELGRSASVARPSGGQVVAVVRGAAPSTMGSYLLQVYTQPITAPEVCGEDALELGSANGSTPNNTFANGHAIAAGGWETNLIACPGDADWYRFASPAGMDLRITIETHLLASGLLDAQVWGITGPPGGSLSMIESSDGGLLEILVPWYAIFDGGQQAIEVRSTSGDPVWYDLRVDILP